VPPDGRSHRSQEHWARPDRPTSAAPACAVCRQKRDKKAACDPGLVETLDEAREVLVYLRACPGCGLRRDEVTAATIRQIYIERWRALRTASAAGSPPRTGPAAAG
jgi:hypothetical protein